MISSLKNQKGQANTILLVIIVVLLLALIGGAVYYFVIGKNKTTTTSTSTTNATIATTTNTAVAANTNTAIIVTTPVSTSLANVKDGKGTGTATYQKINGKYTLKITTTGLPEPQKDYIYNAWIEKKLTAVKINAGEVKKTKDDGIYTLEFTSDTDYSAFRFVYVTLEPEKTATTATIPGTLVLSGTFGL